MKKLKFLMLTSAFFVAVAVAFAFNMPAKKQVDEMYFQLVANGDPLERTDWVLAEESSCPTTHTDIVCRIKAVPDGDNPDATDFADILSNSSNFGTAYPAKVSYVPEP